MNTNFKLIPLLGLIGLFASCNSDEVTFPDVDDIQIDSRSCSSTEDSFTLNVLPIIAQCSACHFDHDANAELKVVNGEQYSNYLSLTQYIEAGHDQTLLDKPTGDNDVLHGGGNRFTNTSDEYTALVDFIALVKSGVDEEGACANLNQVASVDVNLESYRQTLRKSTLLFAGRLPTSAEYSDAKNKSTLRKVLKESVMVGENFDKFLMESANDKLLTEKFSGRTSVQTTYYPLRDILYDVELEVNLEENLELELQFGLVGD